MANSAADTAHQVRQSKATQLLGRAGMVCYGLVHVIIAYLAARIVFGGSGQKADQHGAVAEIGTTSFGTVVLWVLVVGLFAFGLWQFLLAATGYTWIGKERKRTVKRIGSAARGVVGISLAVYALEFATGSGGGGSSDQQQKELTGRLLELPAGRVLVAIVAAVVIGIGVASVVKGVKASFMRDLDTGDLPTGTRTWVKRLGTTGYVAKGVAFGVVGLLIGTAAVTSDAGESGGLDAALRTLADQPFGPYLLIAVALGFAAFGVYCFAAAKSHKS